MAVAMAAASVGTPTLATDTRVAVVVGSNVGLAHEAPLEHAEEDAKRMHGLLTRIGAVRADRAALVVSPRPRDVVRAIDVATGKLQELSQKGAATFIMYISAHADADALHLDGERLSLAALREQVERIPARLRLIIIDACRTPPVRAQIKGGRPGPPVAVKLDRDGAVEGTVIISATGTGAPAQEWADLRGGLFTHHLMTALRGVADFDQDGRVSLIEAYTYAYRQTGRRSVEGTAIRQRPSFDFDLRGHGQWIFTRPPGLGAVLVLGPGLDGDLWIADRSGRLVAEVPKRKGDTVHVAVLPEQYRVVAPAGAFAWAADVTLTWGGQVTVDQKDLVRLPATRARLRGGGPIVARPWRITVGYGLSSISPVSGVDVLHVGELGFERVWGGVWVLRGSVGATATTLQASNLDIQHRELRLRVGAAYEIPVWMVTAGFGVEVHPRFIFQQVNRDRAEEIERVFGATEPDRSGAHLGLAGFAYLRVPLVSRLAWAIDVGSGVLWSQDVQDDELRTGLMVEVRTNLAWSF